MWLWVPVDGSAIRLVRVGTRYTSRVLVVLVLWCLARSALVLAFASYTSMIRIDN